MKERPILMNGDMVRAVLAGKKTQTRRIIKPQPEQGFDWPEESFGDGWQWLDAPGDDDMANFWPSYQQGLHCPFGVVGDRLWVRETISCGSKQGHEFGEPVYAADGYCDVLLQPHTTIAHEDLRWTPSIHMPKWASRITLEITDVRVQRVKEITQEDAQVEGVEPGCRTCGENCAYIGGCGQCLPDYRDSFAGLWQSIYGSDSWCANPWVWAITFKRIDQ